MSRVTRHLSDAGLVISALLIGLGAVLLITPAPALANARLWGTLLIQVLWVMLALCGAALSRSRSLGERLGLGRGQLPISTSLVVMVGFIALSSALHQGLVSFELRETGSLAQIDAVVREARARAPSFLLVLLAMGIAPGFGEEILFRGFIQRGLASRLGPHWGVLLAAAIFGLAHFDLVHSALAFLLGAYLGVVTQLAGGIRTAILCHVVNNTLGILAPALIPSALSIGGAWGIPPLVALGGASLLYAGRRRRTAEGSRGPVPRQEFPRGESTRFRG
jgi:membrane protease YdiL (CAAX protease family)